MPEVRFLLVEHIARAIAQGMRRRGIDAMTAAEAGLVGAADWEHLARAHAEGRVFVTHDRDFLRLHHEGREHAGIAYCRQGLRSTGQLIAALILVHEVLEPDAMIGRVEFL